MAGTPSTSYARVPPRPTPSRDSHRVPPPTPAPHPTPRADFVRNFIGERLPAYAELRAGSDEQRRNGLKSALKEITISREEAWRGEFANILAVSHRWESRTRRRAPAACPPGTRRLTSA